MNSEIGFLWAKLSSKIKCDTKERDKLRFFAKKGVKFPGGAMESIFTLILRKMSLI